LITVTDKLQILLKYCRYIIDVAKIFTKGCAVKVKVTFKSQSQMCHILPGNIAVEQEIKLG